MKERIDPWRTAAKLTMSAGLLFAVYHALTGVHNWIEADNLWTLSEEAGDRWNFDLQEPLQAEHFKERDNVNEHLILGSGGAVLSVIAGAVYFDRKFERRSTGNHDTTWRTMALDRPLKLGGAVTLAGGLAFGAVKSFDQPPVSYDYVSQAYEVTGSIDVTNPDMNPDASGFIIAGAGLGLCLVSGAASVVDRYRQYS